MPATLVTGAPLEGGAIEGRGGWVWSFASNQATTQSTWPALDGGVSLGLAGQSFLWQQTPGLGARGAGSARINQALFIDDAAARWSASGFPNPTNTAMLFRLIFRETHKIGASTYFELSEAAQRLTIRRTGTTLEFVGELGAYTESIDFEAFIGEYVLLDVLVNFTTGFRVFLNGIDLTPSFAGSALTPFAGDATLSLLNNTSATEGATYAELVFAGIAMSPTLEIQNHREDAYHLEVLANGLAFELGDFTWAWSPNRLDTSTEPIVSLPAEPDFGNLDARLSMSDTDETVRADEPTGLLRPEGLGRPRLGHALTPAVSSSTVRLPAPSTLAAIDGDVHLRLIFKVTSDLVDDQRVLFFEDETDPTLRLGVTVEPGGNLVVSGPSGYTVTAAAAVGLDGWHLLDISLDRDGGGGGEAKLIGLLDGVDLGFADHVATVSDIPLGAEVTVFDDKALAGAATETSLVFWAISHGRVLSTARHVLDALALGVI